MDASGQFRHHTDLMQSYVATDGSLHLVADKQTIARVGGLGGGSGMG